MADIDSFEDWLRWTYSFKQTEPRTFIHTIKDGAFVTYEWIDGQLKEVRRTPADQVQA
jgi:hypothetical protein